MSGRGGVWRLEYDELEYGRLGCAVLPIFSEPFLRFSLIYA